jgi:hypothetical protein
MTSAANTPAAGGMPYRPDPVPGWGDAVASWPWQPWLEHDVALGWTKTGACPYCDHRSRGRTSPAHPTRPNGTRPR